MTEAAGLAVPPLAQVLRVVYERPDLLEMMHRSRPQGVPEELHAHVYKGGGKGQWGGPARPGVLAPAPRVGRISHHRPGPEPKDQELAGACRSLQELAGACLQELAGACRGLQGPAGA